ncbi:nucleoside-diphosphate kinase [Candidatus Uhrbacteria bacterium]|nr:nucleoside-diphosphate kinase [Candidatus Uhrbacteria bacterium]
MMEQTLVVVKPDGVKRNLIGKIISYYEAGGLKVKTLKMLTVSEALIDKHYPEMDDYLVSLGKKSEKAGDKIDDYRAQGLKIVQGLKKYITSGPVVKMILEGEDAIKQVRAITGYTDPKSAEKGTIRGDMGEDSILEANRENRPVKNLIHASGNSEEAATEITLWFSPEELV